MRTKALIAPFIILALPAVLLWRALFLGEVFAPARLLEDVAPWRTDWAHVNIPWNPLQWDGIGQFYPWRTFAANSLRHGILPFWNPHQFCGTPFVANSQSAIFYPPNLLFALVPTPAAFGVSAWLHMAATGCFTYIFLRRSLVRSRSAALFGAVTWQLCTWQVSWLALPTFLCVTTWLPLALYLVKRTSDRPAAANAGGLGAVLGIMLLAGHFQVFLYCFLLCVAYYLTLLASPAPFASRRSAVLGRIGAGALAAAIMVLAGSAQLLPSIELSRLSHRAGGVVNWSSYQDYIKLATPTFHLVSLVQPDFFGNPTAGTYWSVTNYAENACYVGIAGIVLAFLGIAAWRSLPQSRFFAIAGVVALLAAVGTPVDAVLYFGIPGFSQTGSPGRILALWSFCAAVLAAFGLDTLLDCPPKQIVRRLSVGILAVLALAGIILAFAKPFFDKNLGAGGLELKLSQEPDLWRLPVALLMLVLLLAAAVGASRFSVRTMAHAFVAVAAVDLLVSGIGYNPTSRASDVYPVTPAIAFLQQHASDGRIMPANRFWSIDPSQPPPAVLPPNAATLYGLDDTQGYNSLFPGQYMAFAARLNGDGRSPAPQENGNMVFTRGIGSDLAREAAVRYIVTLAPLEIQPPGISLVMTDGRVSVYEDTKTQSRVTDASGSPLQYRDISCNSVTARAGQMLPDGESIVVRDQYYPGWVATADGVKVPITAGPDIFRTVDLPASSATAKEVKLTFAPASIQVGIFGLCLALAILSGLLTSRVQSKRAARPLSGSSA